MRTALFLGALALGTTGCEISSEFLQRMEVQPRYSYYEGNEFFEDGRAMRMPPPGTVAREHPAGNPALSTGRVGGQLVNTIPVKLDRTVLARGQKKFNIVCAQCHGVLGDGNSIVAENMALRLPPSLLNLAEKPSGHFYTAITEGYGVMPSFAGELTVQDRWAVVAYVRALQAARNTTLSGAPGQENR